MIEAATVGSKMGRFLTVDEGRNRSRGRRKASSYGLAAPVVG